MTVKSTVWPILKSYPQSHLSHVAMPVGGIGTGTISIGGRGNLRDWEICNRSAKGFDLVQGRQAGCFFALWTKDSSGKTVTRALEGIIGSDQYDGKGHGAWAVNASLPRFRKCEFHAAYPLAQVVMSDPDVPLHVRLETFNPLIPADVDSSGIPVMVLRYVLTNPSSKPVAASVCGSLPNFIGADGRATSNKQFEGFDSYDSQARENRNVFRKDSKLQGLYMYSDGLEKTASQWGSLALATTARGQVTWREAWGKLDWGNSLLDFWDDFSSDGKLDARPADGQQDPRASLAVSVQVPPKASKSVTFIIAWHFPNRNGWAKLPDAGTAATDSAAPQNPIAEEVGNYYCTQYADAWDVAVRTAGDLPRLESKTVEFVQAFCRSDLPDVVKEAALFNLSTLRTETCFRTADGRFFGWEGCHDLGGCCHGSCTHVWNYEHTTAFVFGQLAKSMRDTDFNCATSDTGMMSFRVGLPVLSQGREWKGAAADGQMGTLMRLYREWQLSGDDEFLKKCWPSARKSMEFCWLEHGWDGDCDGVMEGSQHNTMDVEYFGPNPEVGFWYLGALRAVEEMARHVGEESFAKKCQALIVRGSQWMDSNLFNGEYYEQRIVPPGDESAINPALRWNLGPRDLRNPTLQIGAGCLADQLVGQTMAHVLGLGDLADRQHLKKTLQSLMKYNFRSSMFGHFNHMRTYTLNEEGGMLVCTYPRGQRPQFPFPYANEVWSGFEYAVATELIYAGRLADALKIVKTVRARHDGRKRSPFDEPECGHHYVRPMAAWGTLLAITGFRYSAVTGHIVFNLPVKNSTTWFWSTGYAWGTVVIRKKTGGLAEVTLSVLGGTVKLKTVELATFGKVDLGSERIIGSHNPLRLKILRQI